MEPGPLGPRQQLSQQHSLHSQRWHYRRHHRQHDPADPNQVTITVAWPDGNNNVESRVQATLNTTWHPLVLFIFGNLTVNLSASSTMPVAH
jgi:hypothetical protein